jgi:hypothetical protein
MKDGWCTVLFYCFLANKAATMTVKGGNDGIYKIENGRLKMAQSLVEQHPDIASISWKWGRWQHQVDYSRFKRNVPILRKDAQVTEGINNYGMTLQIDDEVNDDTETESDTVSCAANS